MITKIAIENFKGIGGRVELKCEAFHPDSEDYFSGPEPDEPEWLTSKRYPGIPTKPLTLLFGPNSGGKSTILHALHYAREIFERLNSNADRTISGGDFVDLGGFANLVHDHDLEKTVWLRVDWVDYPPRDDHDRPDDSQLL